MEGPELNPATDPDVRASAAANEPTALGSATTADVQGELQAALDDARAKAAQHYDLYLRARAETENTRRRAQDDIAKAHKFAVESFAEALLPVVDSLEKALDAAAGTSTSLREGIEITLRQLRSAFEKNRLSEINPLGEKFDPHRHQAISMVPAEGMPPNHVAAVLQKGWMIADRVLRPALVTVAQG
ncbi:MAG TPA: nucleotide exchange factor GrpE [Burkholderiaceae bacterium]|nr:nucleotide exchange factor GrpE [Burkholderiaceae bacterium]